MFSITHKVNFQQTDRGGILFYAELFKIAHITYELLFDSFNLEENYFESTNYAIPIIHTEADFFTPIKFGDNLECSVYIENIKTTSFELFYIFKVNDELVAKMQTIHVVVKQSNFEKTEIPEELLKKLKKNLGK